MDNSTYEIMLKKALSDFARGMAGANSNGITYDDAFGLADECGISASGALSGVTDAVLNGEISLSEGKALIARVMSASSTLSEGFAMEAQSGVNAEAGVNLEILGADRRATLNRISNLTEKYGSYADLQKGDFLLGEAIQSVFARQTVADTARRNADFHESAGLYVKINRIGAAGCCKWCGEVSGIYDKGSAPNDVWRFHKNCNCSLEYKSGKTSSRISFRTNDNGSMEKNTESNLQEVYESGHRGLDRDTEINYRAINSHDYKRKFENLDESTDIIKILWKEAKEILNHRNGTYYEDILFVNAETSRFLKRTDYDNIKSVLPSRRMIRMVESSNKHTIIALHNHPGSSFPSIDDINNAYKHNYRYGLIACHNGNVFKYTVVGELNEVNVDILLDNAEQYYYYNKTLKLKETLAKLEEGGLKLEIL